MTDFILLDARRLMYMNKLKTLLLSIALLLTGFNSANCASLSSTISKSEINKMATVAVSVKDAKTGKVVYEYNEHKLMNPASVQKIFTMYSAYNELGGDYTFKTGAYIDSVGNLYIKLGADPSLTTATLKMLLKSTAAKYKKPVKDIVIDPTIIDNKQWGIGWMWDDDTNPLLPKYSPFSINENKIDITITPSKNGRQPEIKNKSSYPMTIVNTLTNSNNTKLTFERQPWHSGDMTFIKGSVSSPVKVQLPVTSPERYFRAELNSAIAQSGLKYSGVIKVAPTPKNAKELAVVSSEPLSKLVANTLKNSNNFYSEMIFKAAAAHAINGQGSTEKGIELFNNYFKDTNEDKVLIVDACGISRNNLMSADWITNSLNKIYSESNFEEFSQLMAKPVEGTLSDRLLNISLKLRAKTGTASGISTIAGYIDAQNGKKYSFAILIQNYNMDTLEVKKFEDKLINEIYKM